MIAIQRNSIFLIDREKDKPDGKLRYRIKWNGNTVAFNVGYRVEPDKWSNDTQRVKNNTSHGVKKISASIINREIGRFEQIAENVFSQFEVSDKIPTANEFRFNFNKQNGKVTTANDPTNFFEILDLFVSENGQTNQWVKGTFQKFITLKRHLQNFNPNITFTTLDQNTLQAYVTYLRDELDMRNVSIRKQLDFLKWFLRWATANEYNSNLAYVGFLPKFKIAEKKVIFLDWAELMTVYNFVVPDNDTIVNLTDSNGKAYTKLAHNTSSIAKVRDVFCFCCFTSLRYSDVANLRRSNVYDDYISITTIKTGDSLKIELNDYSRAILKKYEGETFAKDLALPVISNQKMNNYLKELGELCGINKPITVTYFKGNNRHDDVHPKYALIGTHCGRRTFICNALMLGIAPQVVMKWTGHSDYKAMKPYIDVADSAKADAMKVFNRKSPIQ